MINYIATSTFGLESIVKREVSNLGFENISVLDGRIDFSGDISAIPRANLWLRSADRLLVRIGEFKAVTFDELFEQTKTLPWGDWITKDGKFTVNGKSIKSTLFSVPDCQAIVKKAIVEKLKLKYKDVEWFSESGSVYMVTVGLLKDIATITIDTTGAGLHKRGYRKEMVKAPLKETLAAAMIDLSYWKKERPMLDPFCGSGTIPIEAALIGKNIAPGINRSFASEDWSIVDKKIWKTEKERAFDLIDKSVKLDITGYDIDKNAVEIAKHNAKKAGVSDCINFFEKDFYDVEVEKDYGVLISNPSYGERIGEINQIKLLFEEMGRKFRKAKTWSLYIISSEEQFEKLYGRKADKKRKLFNGNIKTDYYQYFGEKPKLQQ